MDTETILKNAVDLVQTKLGAEITAVNTAKGDSLLTAIPNDAYFFAQVPKVFNYPTFMVYGFADTEISAAQADNNLRVIRIYFEVVSVDSGDVFDKNIIYKLLRYSQALERVFLKNPDKVTQGYGKLEVSQLVPATLFGQGNKTVRSSGVQVVARITAR